MRRKDCFSFKGNRQDAMWLLKSASASFEEMGFKREEIEEKDYETQIYYDKEDHSLYSNSFLLHGGFLRQVIAKDKKKNPCAYFVDYQSSASALARRYDSDRKLVPVEVKKFTEIAGKIVPVFELDCETKRYIFRKEIYKDCVVCVELSFQKAEIINSETGKTGTFNFIVLADKTIYANNYLGAQMEHEIEKVFKDFNSEMNLCSFVKNKYISILYFVNDNKLEKKPSKTEFLF